MATKLQEISVALVISAKEENDKIVIREKIEEQKEKLFENISNIKEWIVLELKTDALNVINRYLSEKKQSIIKSIENLWDKYQVSLKEIENQRDEATNEIKSFLSELGYL
jgi:type I restriction enzyme M protein